MQGLDEEAEAEETAAEWEATLKASTRTGLRQDLSPIPSRQPASRLLLPGGRVRSRRRKTLGYTAASGRGAGAAGLEDTVPESPGRAGTEVPGDLPSGANGNNEDER